MRIGVFGGTFDPVHFGHLILAEQAREQAHLDQVRFMLAARPPHKQCREPTPFRHRAAMLSLALAGNPAFIVDDREIDRAGPSYTVDTLQDLHRSFPEAQWFLLMGMDMLLDFGNWKDPDQIARLAEIIVMGRPGWAIPDALEAVGARFRVLSEVPMISISSRDLRIRASEGKSLRYLVPRAVECYIQTHSIY
jgi:nicotinate-nucleotide adenylyltransferase